MANATSNKAILQNAADTATNIVKRPKPVIPLVRTGLRENPESMFQGGQFGGSGSGPTQETAPTPVAPKGTGGAPTPEAAALPVAPVPTAEDFRSAAEDTPELAAFKALINAPAPVFQKAGFTTAERVALGLLAGLKGIEATLPIMQQRRQDAMVAYEAAKDARAERLRGLYEVAQIGQQERQRAVENKRADAAMAQAKADREESKRRFEAGLGMQKEHLKLAKETAERQEAKAAEALKGRDLPARYAVDLGQAINAARQADQFLKDFGTSFPGNPVTTLGGNVAIGQGQRDVRASLQAATNEIKTKLLGSARTLTELQDVSGFLPAFGDLDATIVTGMKTVKSQTLARVRTEIATLKASGYNTEALEKMLHDNNFTGISVVPRAMPPLMPGMTIDPGYVLSTPEDGFDEEAPQEHL